MGRVSVIGSVIEDESVVIAVVDKRSGCRQRVKAGTDAQAVVVEHCHVYRVVCVA